MRRRRVLSLPALGLVLACVLAAAPAHGASRVIVRGAGFGHGVGMSQFGAFGFAKQGRDHRFILRHYYRGTRIGDTGAREARVLVQTAGRITFSGATAAVGLRSLNPGTTYRVTRAPSGRMTLRSPAGRKLERTREPLVIRGGGEGIRLAGRSGNAVTDGRYRGDLDIRPSGGDLTAINVLDLEDYIRGVVAGESPSGWPRAALRAQAVAARTYALVTSKAGNGFDQYSDTRSQVYNGMAGETPSTDAVVDDTAGEIVTYRGQPVVTYYFSTSGGRTENVENTDLGTAPMPWLRSVSDPYDDGSPKHRWVRRTTLGEAARLLAPLVRGRLREIRVLRRGRSPRVVRGLLVGSDGVTRVTGAQLRRELGLFDTWATFTVIVADAGQRDRPAAARSRSGGTTPVAARRGRRAGVVDGRVVPAKAGRWVAVQRRVKGRWVTQFEDQIGPGGRFRAAVRSPGAYRIQYRREAGPVVRVR